MREMIKHILASPVPVATYVAPSGARAASAGTFILYASHHAAMAPGTNLGAASPVSIGGVQKDEKKDSGADTMTKKVTNDAVAYIRSLAQLRGRNADWGEKAVREAVSLPAEEAVKLKVIDHVATDVPDLLKKLGKAQLRQVGPGRGRLAHPHPRRDHQPERRLHPDSARHLRADLRVHQPRADPARRGGRDLHPARAVLVPPLAGELRRPRAHAARHCLHGGGSVPAGVRLARHRRADRVRARLDHPDRYRRRAGLRDSLHADRRRGRGERGCS